MEEIGLSNNSYSEQELHKEDEGFDFKKVLIPALIVVVLIVGIFWFLNRKVANGFSGNVVSIDGQEILVSGVYSVENKEKNEPTPEPVNVIVLVTDQTQIERTAFEIPKTGEAFRPRDLPQEVSVVDLDQLKLDANRRAVGLKIKTKGNVYNKENFEALEISYFVPSL